MINKQIEIENSNILILGLTFKENCPDIRNTQVLSIVQELKKLNSKIDVYDPWVDKDRLINENNFQLIEYPIPNKYDAIIVAVSHDEFKKLSIANIRKFGKEKHVIYDIKYMLDPKEVDGKL